MKIIMSLLKQLTGFSGATFTIGAILIIFGVAKGIPGFGLEIDDGQRLTAVLCGLILAIASLILKSKESTEPIEFTPPGYKFGDVLAKPEKEKEPDVMELEENIRKRDRIEHLNDEELSPTQKRIIEIIVDEYRSGGIVNQSFIDNEIKIFLKITKRSQISMDEMYYRLEFLVKRGYINRFPTGHPDKKTKRNLYAYKPSIQFRDKFGIPTTIVTNRYGS